MDYNVLVKPGSKKGPLVENDGSGGLTIYVRERAVEGRANQAVIALLAEYFGVAKSRITIISGQAARTKRMRIA